jgi:hypothetical protein
MNRLAPLMALVVILPMASCVMSKTYTDEEKKMRMGPDQYFVIKTNSEKVAGNKISLAGGLTSGGPVKLDGQKYQFDELLNVQDRHAYYAKFNNLWVKQLKRGKINLYYFETSTPMMGATPSSPTRYEYHQHFVFQKGDGPMQELSKEAISEMLSDNREAQAKFDAQFHPGQKFLPKQLDKHPKVLFDVIDMYNNG